MFYITGDTHIPIDIQKLSLEDFPLQNQLTKKDYVIICGDFGGVWDDSEIREQCIQKLHDSNFTTLFIDGNHENFDLLNAMPVSEWNGGKVHYVRDSIIHLMRGQVYNIEGTKFFTMGGGYSIDKVFRTPHKSWWHQELPSKAEYEEARRNLQENNNEIDFVISHTCPTILRKYFKRCEESVPEWELQDFLQLVTQNVKFKMWFFGHMHKDCLVEDKYLALYQNIYDLKNNVIISKGGDLRDSEPVKADV